MTYNSKRESQRDWLGKQYLKQSNIEEGMRVKPRRRDVTHARGTVNASAVRQMHEIPLYKSAQLYTNANPLGVHAIYQC